MKPAVLFWKKGCCNVKYAVLEKKVAAMWNWQFCFGKEVVAM